LGLDEKIAGTKAENPLVSCQKRGRETQRESSDNARVVTDAKAMWRTVCGDWIFKQQPPETPFDAQRIPLKRVWNRRILSPIAGPPVQEAGHIGQR
jgi:hypothetical protein